MNIWFLADPIRLSEERIAIDNLQQKVDWLIGTKWTISNTELAIEASIIALDNTYNVRMIYPDHFPYSPPIVRPTNSSELWSTHQYRDGALCLEWGPDTWVSTVTGAQILESVYRLLEIENPFDSDNKTIAPSRHFLTKGQELRNTLLRIYISNSCQKFILTLPNLTSGTMLYSTHHQRDSYSILIHKVTPISGDAWYDTEIPNALRGKSNIWFSHGLIFTTELKYAKLSRLSTLSDIEGVLKAAGYGDIVLSGSDNEPIFGLDEDPETIIITDVNHVPHVYTSYQEDKFIKVKNLLADDGTSHLRTPVELQPLSKKRIGIVGLGSLGSKIAVALARMGVKNFYLVDDDILLPENLCRHELDWRSVGEHKTAAVAQAIDNILYDAKIEISKVNITGQENPVVVNGVLDKLSHCDIILDMTAASQVSIFFLESLYKVKYHLFGQKYLLAVLVD